MNPASVSSCNILLGIVTRMDTSHLTRRTEHWKLTRIKLILSSSGSGQALAQAHSGSLWLLLFHFDSVT